MSDNAYNSTIILCRIISLLCAMIDFFVFFMQSLKRQELDSQFEAAMKKYIAGGRNGPMPPCPKYEKFGSGQGSAYR